MATPASRGTPENAAPSSAPAMTYEDEYGPLSRMRRNPGAWGVALGAAIVLVSLFLVWIEATNHATGESERVRAISSFSGQTLFFAGLLAVGAGIAIAMVTSSGWRIFWAIAGLLLGALFVAAAAWAIFDPEGFTQHAVKAQLFASMTSQFEMQDASARLSAAFASGTVTASAGIGAIIGLIGGGLTVLGALVSFARRPSSA
jgi:hypothetical protein